MVNESLRDNLLGYGHPRHWWIPALPAGMARWGLNAYACRYTGTEVEIREACAYWVHIVLADGRDVWVTWGAVDEVDRSSARKATLKERRIYEQDDR